MDIKESATYPYPIWGLHDSFLGEEPKISELEKKSNNETNSLDISFEVTEHKVGIDQLISEGRAKYTCIVECKPTYFQKQFDFTSPQIKISIPYDKVFNRVSVKTYIVATEEIIQCNYLELDEIYEGTADYPKGGVIAYISEFVIPLEQKNNASDLSKIVRVMKTDIDRVRNIYSESRIIIKIPKEYGERYDRVSSLCPAVIESNLVYNALVQAIYNLRSDTNDSKDWVFYLQQFIKECNDKDIINMDGDDYNIELEDIYTLVDHLLDKPQLNAIDSVIRHTETEN